MILAGMFGTQVPSGGGGTPMIFGYNGTVEGTFPPSSGRSMFSIFNKSNAGAITSINYYHPATASTGQVRLAAYAVSAGYPTTLLWTTAIESPTPGAWHEFALPSDVSGTTPAGDYALVECAVDFAVGYLGKTNSSLTPDTYRKEGWNFASPQTTYMTGPADASYDGCVGIYCDYLGT